MDNPGHESLRLSSSASGWQFLGTAVFAFERIPCRLDYLVRCDSQWRTVSATVSGWVGSDVVEHEVSVDGSGRWRFNGTERPNLDGFIDVDLAFSPCTNTLPIRRLELAVGQSAPVRAVWLRFPGFAVERLDQIYSRVDVSRYRYESGGGSFVTELEVDADGLVTSYPSLWETVGAI